MTHLNCSYDKNVIYEIPCTDCKLVQIGQAKKKHHQNDLKFGKYCKKSIR